MLIRLRLAAILVALLSMTSMARAQDSWLEDIVRQWEKQDRALALQSGNVKTPLQTGRQPAPWVTTVEPRTTFWQTSEPEPGPLPTVPHTVEKTEGHVIYVWLRERVAAVYLNGALVRAMPIVPGSKNDPSEWLIGKTIVIGAKTKDYRSTKLYPDGRGGMSPARMPYAQRLRVLQTNGTWLESGYFFHKGDMSVWKSPNLGSHGCLRLTWQHSIWLFENIPTGTPVVVMRDMQNMLASQ